MNHIDAVPPHGGPDAQGAPEHDFSTNANACGPCPQALAAVREADPTRYPDPAYTRLREQLAAFHGVRPERIVLAGSASEFIARITLAVADGGGVVQVPAHSYGDYPRAARMHGLGVVSASEGHGTASSRTGESPPLRLVWACDPSSPLGGAHQGLNERIDSLPAHIPLVLDRAYESLRLSGALAVPAAPLSRVWQLWSPNKALGLTGLRGAYAIAPDVDAQANLCRRVQELAPSWPLGAHAVTMLESWATPDTQNWVAECLPVLRAWKAAQEELCRSLGWTVLDSHANYFCADWRQGLANAGLQPAQALAKLRAQGIKLRDCTSFGLPGHVRLGVRPPASQQALADAVRTLARRR